MRTEKEFIDGRYQMVPKKVPTWVVEGKGLNRRARRAMASCMRRKIPAHVAQARIMVAQYGASK